MVGLNLSWLFIAAFSSFRSDQSQNLSLLFISMRGKMIYDLPPTLFNHKRPNMNRNFVPLRFYLGSIIVDLSFWVSHCGKSNPIMTVGKQYFDKNTLGWLLNTLRTLLAF